MPVTPRGSGASGDNREITPSPTRWLCASSAGSSTPSIRTTSFFFEQEGSFVVRLFGTAGSRAGSHSLSEFTHDEMLGMIEDARQEQRR